MLIRYQRIDRDFGALMMVTMEEGTELPYRFSVEFSDVDDYDRAIAFLRDEIGKPMMVLQKRAQRAHR
jgi:hypothetical protein